ncbi:MAG: helix-turn-helix domain-containing protein [Oceanococcus sp.]
MDESLHNQSNLLIPARYYLKVGEILLRSGIRLDQLLQPLDLSLAQLSQPNASLKLGQIDQLVQSAVALTGHQDLGFELGRVLKLSSHDIVGFGILSSPNVDYALRLVSRFFRLILPAFQMRFHCDQTRMQLSFKPIAPMSSLCLQVHLEAIATAVHFELADLLQTELPPYQLRLSITEPGHAGRYRELKGAQVQFLALSRPSLEFEFPAFLARRPLSLADESALKMAEARCRDMVQQVIDQREVAAWVRMMLSDGGHGLPSLSELAHTLNLSTRTLDRHLKREGSGYRELLQNARLQRAKARLAEGSVAITIIAHELGYTDAANFTRAFRTLTGLSPSKYRTAEQKKRPV